MKRWLAGIMWDALGIFLSRVRDYALSSERNAKQRYKDRLRWWHYKEKAEESGNVTAKMLAEALQIRFKFETPPADAVARGDLSER